MGLTAVITRLTDTGRIPAYSATVYAIISLVIILIGLEIFRRAGFLYCFGWLAGYLRARGWLEPLDIALNSAAPTLILVLRFGFWAKSFAFGR